MKKISINYLFFSLFILLLISFSIFPIERKALFLPLFFLQSLTEILILILILHHLKGLLKWLFVAVISLIPIIKFINLLLVVLINSSISYAYNMLFADGFKSTLVNIQAADINSLLLLLIISFLLLFPTAAAVLYKYLEKLSNKNPLLIKRKTLLLSILSLSSIYLLSDLFISKNLERSDLVTLKNALLYTLPPPSKEKTVCKLKNIKDEKIAYKLKRKPHIFLFVIESLRHDSIKKDVAPALFSFKEKNLSFKYSFSNSSASHMSWFSIFTSRFPNNWNSYKPGAVPLKILKDLGYQINIFSSADLRLFNMEEILFDKNRSLTDNFFHPKDKRSYVRDKKIFSLLKENLSHSPSINIIFLDSTHSEYLLPKEFKKKFTPFSKSINYLSLAYSKKGLFLIKNSYLNCINYLDSLFSDFFSLLKEKNIYKDSVIIITADHGEEFFDKSSLFHATSLNNYQIKIPIYYKLPKNFDIDRDIVTTQADIFPTVIDFLTDKAPLFDGGSILRKKRDFALSANQNCKNDPKEYVLLFDKKKVLINVEKLKNNLSFEIVSTTDLDDKKLPNIDKDIVKKKILENLYL